MDHSPAFLALVESIMPQVTEIGAEETKARLARGESFEFVDVREDGEWDAEHARGARHIGRGVIERDIEKLVPEKDRELVLYCGGGFRSALAAVSLQAMGYTRVRSMTGGYRAWKAADGDTEKG